MKDKKTPFEKIRYREFTEKGLRLIGWVIEDVEPMPKNGLFVEFVSRYYAPTGENFLIQRGLCLLSNDVDNLLDWCGKEWTIITIHKTTPIVNNYINNDLAIPYIKII